MGLPSETRDNASKQLYWRLKRLGLESTPSNNNNYNNNYMFIYTIYRLKKCHAVAFLKIMKNLQQCIKINVEFKIALVIFP